MSGGQGFWTRRRAAVAAEEDARARDAEEAEAVRQAAALEEKSDAEVLAELDLPDPDTLGAGDDFRAFMHRSVPLRLRQRALRRLWRSNPALACLDGLNDYDGDFTDAATAAPGLKTAYEVGRGLWRRAGAVADGADAPKAGSTPPREEDAPASADAAPGEPETARATEGAPGPEQTGDSDRGAEPADPGVPDARPRRMAFRFQD